MLGSKISNVQENRRFAAPFLHSELRRELRKITWRWEKSKVGLDYRIVNKIMCSLEGGYGIFQMCVNPEAQRQRTGFAESQDKPSLKTLCAWGMTTSHDLGSWEFMIRTPCEVTFHRTSFFVHNTVLRLSLRTIFTLHS